VNKKIGKFYTPFQAQTYEIQRKNPIWEAEEVVYEKVIQRVHNEYSEKNLSILDLPVGTGRWIPFANSYCSRYVGIDISENMLSEARKKISRMGNVDGSKYSLYNSSYAAVAELNLGKFDLVVSTRFLPHFHIAEIQDILNVLTSHCNGAGCRK
jgi:ubiquinone/menaquinone biosynthesis C-methylase UbiE